MPDTGSGIVYHYCSLEAFKSIIENECLWLCDLEKSNDSAERIYFENIMLEQIDRYTEDLKSKNDDDKERALQALQLVKEAIQNPETERAPVYSCSFSFNGDQLSQWRGYADDGYGVSIGFWVYGFEQNLPNNTFGKVIYTYEQAKETCWDILQTSFQYCKDSNEADSDLSYKSLFGANVFSSLERNNIFFKSSAFSEEQEFRIAILPIGSRFSSSTHTFIPGGFKLFSNDITSNFCLSGVNFRITRRKLSSYLELSFSKAKDCIATINLGPKCLATPKDIRSFLALNDYEVSDIEINTSSATYR